MLETSFHPSMERRKGERERGGKKEGKNRGKQLGVIYLILLELEAEKEAETDRNTTERQIDKDRLTTPSANWIPMTSTNYFIQPQGKPRSSQSL